MKWKRILERRKEREEQKQAKARRKRKTLTSKDDVLEYLRKVRPRYYLRMPLWGRKHPFLYKKGEEIPGNNIQVSDAVFYRLKSRKRIVLHRSVNNSKYKYQDWKLA